MTTAIEQWDKSKPQYADGFWWWYDPIRKGWYIGTAPCFQKPSWAQKV